MAGVFTCLAANGVQPNVSKSISVTVHCKLMYIRTVTFKRSGTMFKNQIIPNLTYCMQMQYKEFSARMGNLEDIRAEDFDVLFDGIFCKYSIDAFWFDDEKEHENHIKELVKLIKRGGWAWIAPWNGAYKDKNLSQEDVDKALSVQTNVFKKEGFTALELTEELSKYYGVHGITANRALFILNLKSPKTLEVCKRL